MAGKLLAFRPHGSHILHNPGRPELLLQRLGDYLSWPLGGLGDHRDC
jgi:hypothetical protein